MSLSVISRRFAYHSFRSYNSCPHLAQQSLIQLDAPSAPPSEPSFKSISSLPTIRYDCAADATPPQINEIELELFQQHKGHESGMMNLRSQWNGNKPTLVATHSSTLGQLFEHERKGSIHSLWPETFNHLFRDALPTINGDKHKKIRKIVNPLFIPNAALNERFDVVMDCTQTLFNSLSQQTRERQNIADPFVQLRPQALSWAFDIILSVVFPKGMIDETIHDALSTNFHLWVKGFVDMDIGNLDNPESLLGQAMIGKQHLIEIFSDLTLECIGQYNAKTLDPKCTMFKLLNAVNIIHNGKMIEINHEDKEVQKVELTMEEVADNLTLLVSAGHDTTASSCCNIAYALQTYGEHEFVQQLQHDLQVLHAQGGLFEFDAISNHETLDYFVKEVFRCYPTVTFLQKQFVTDCVINGYMVEKGSQMMINWNMLNRSDEMFGDPLVFDPLRWAENPISKKQYYPFGLGSKKCVGWKLAYLELKILTAMFCTQCDYELDPNRFEQGVNLLNFVDVHGKFRSFE